MAKDKNPVKNGDKLERNPDGTIKSGVLNPNGRPTGTENFSTKWRKAIEKIASQNDMDVDEIEQQLLLVGYKKAKEGDYRFYQDIFDRVYGKPNQTITGADGQPLFFVADNDLTNKYGADTKPEANS